MCKNDAVIFRGIYMAVVHESGKAFVVAILVMQDVRDRNFLLKSSSVEVEHASGATVWTTPLGPRISDVSFRRLHASAT